MKRQSLFGASIAVVASLAVAGSAMAASVFTDSFEGGAAASANILAGSAIGAGWTVTGTDIDWVSDADLWVAQDGHKSIDLNGFGQGGITQTFATTINSTYVVQFYLSGNPGTHAQYPNGDASPTTKTLTVNGQAFTFDTLADGGNSFTNMKWTPEAYTFKATSTSTAISFVSTTVGAFGPAIDNITMTETAATGAQCKDGGWQTMRDASGTLFKNQGACVSFYAKSGATPIGPATQP
jgi:choice-of-anchor C domain-containing protein